MQALTRKLSKQRGRFAHRACSEGEALVLCECATAPMLLTLAFAAAAVDRDLPTVSIIMPTNARPEFVRNALAMIADQDYPRSKLREVVIVDDSPPALRVPGLTEGAQLFETKGAQLKVVYLTLPKLVSIGTKRNFAADEATGEVIVHWDDDDYYGRQRLRAQLAPIVGGATLTMLEHQVTYFMDRDLLKVAEMRWKRTASWGPHFGTQAT